MSDHDAFARILASLYQATLDDGLPLRQCNSFYSNSL